MLRVLHMIRSALSIDLLLVALIIGRFGSSNAGFFHSLEAPERPRKALGRPSELQVGLFDRLWTAKMASQSALGLQVELPKALWAAK